LLPAAQAWGALSAQDRQEKEQFYWSQSRTARGFMGLAVTTIQLLNTLTGDDAVVGGAQLCLAASRAEGCALDWVVSRTDEGTALLCHCLGSACISRLPVQVCVTYARLA
jgi:hypothetical protein